jgi:hypothetical protein
MAKKKEVIEELTVEAPAVAVEETPVVEAPKKISRSIQPDAPKPQPAQLGHTTRAFRGR